MFEYPFYYFNVTKIGCTTIFCGKFLTKIQNYFCNFFVGVMSRYHDDSKNVLKALLVFTFVELTQIKDGL